MALIVTTCNITNLQKYKNLNQLTFSHQAKCHQTECDGAKRANGAILRRLSYSGKREVVEQTTLKIWISSSQQEVQRAWLDVFRSKNILPTDTLPMHTQNIKRHIFLLSFVQPSFLRMVQANGIGHYTSVLRGSRCVYWPQSLDGS